MEIGFPVLSTTQEEGTQHQLLDDVSTCPFPVQLVLKGRVKQQIAPQVSLESCLTNSSSFGGTGGGADSAKELHSWVGNGLA